ncbi:MAG: hypothetical protein ACREPD_10925 [Stenotrophomonas sp.]|uniref:hypothetical protein n=1 Tax=Stenotrophomonas sp. TaxID=69392 RepID=UPI003D6D6E3F
MHNPLGATPHSPGVAETLGWGAGAKMSESVRYTILMVLAIVGALLTLFVMLFDRYHYYDYETAKCKAGPVIVEAMLVGDAYEDDPATGPTPYRLSLSANGDGGQYTLSGVTLTSSQSRGRIAVPSAEATWGADARTSLPENGLLSQTLRLSYDDYTLDGMIHASTDDDHPAVVFSCALKRNHRSEWRASWLDAWMSV